MVSLGEVGASDCEPVVDFLVIRFGGGVDPEGVMFAAGVVEGNGDPMMVAEDVADGVPAALVALFTQAELDGVEQVIGQHADEDVAVNAPFQLMEHRPQPQVALEVLERFLDSGEGGVEFPDLLSFHVLAAGAQQVCSIHAGGFFLFPLQTPPD